MDKLIDKIVALGVPGLVLLMVMSFSGYAGAAAITAALVTVAGPFGGILVGILMLGLLGLIAKGISDYGFENVYQGTVRELKRRGHTKESVLTKIDGYLISSTLKAKLKDYVRKNWDAI